MSKVCIPLYMSICVSESSVSARVMRGATVELVLHMYGSRGDVASRDCWHNLNPPSPGSPIRPLQVLLSLSLTLGTSCVSIDKQPFIGHFGIRTR